MWDLSFFPKTTSSQVAFESFSAQHPDSLITVKTVLYVGVRVCGVTELRPDFLPAETSLNKQLHISHFQLPHVQLSCNSCLLRLLSVT